MARIFTFDDPNFGFGVGSDAPPCCLLAWSDWEHWYTTRAHPRIALPYGTTLKLSPLSRLDDERRALLAWAKQKNPVQGGPPIVEPAQTFSALGTVRKGIPSDPSLNRVMASIEYRQWKRMEKSSGHSLDDIHETILQAIRKARAAWNWVPQHLVIAFHDSNRVMGMATDTIEDPAKKRQRLVSLNRRLLEQFDLPSLERTMLHELAHHKRGEDAWPNRNIPYGGHDDQFCYLLGLVDPRVAASPKDCRYFSDDVNVELAEQAQAKERAKAEAKERAREKRLGQNIWNPAIGEVVLPRLKTTTTLVWQPRADAGISFPAVRFKFTDNELFDLLSRFDRSQWRNVRVVWQRSKPYYVPGDTLEDLVTAFVEQWSQQFPKSLSLLRKAPTGAVRWHGSSR